MPDKADGGSHYQKQKTRDHAFKGRKSRTWRRTAALIASTVLLVVVVVACGQASSPEQPSSEPPQEGDRAPNFTLESSTGDKVALSDFRKRDVLLYFSMGPG
jgi:hypothetical protein